MNAKEDPIEALLRSVYEGTDVDWEAAVRDAGSAERLQVETLRDVARIAEFNRTLMRSPVPGGGPTDRDDPAAEKWGDLLLLERIGSGARADVYRAWDPKLLREVALKLIRDDEGGREADAAESPLLREGRAVARVRHPHVVAVHGIDRHDGRVGLWMELVRGTTLEHDAQTRGALSSDEAARLGIEIGSALAAVHAAGLLHRDVKPANVVRDVEGRFVLADFGLGAKWDRAMLAAARPTGTPMYMAPELFAGTSPSVRSEVYSLGLLLWFALAGRHPFDVDTLDALKAAAGRGPMPRLREARPEVDVELAKIVERAISPAPGARFSTVTELVDALRAFAAGRSLPATGRRPSRALLAVGILVLVAAVAVGVLRPRPDADQRVAVPTSPAANPAALPPALATYAVEASFLKRDDGATTRLAQGDHVAPGDQLSLELRTSRAAWAYVLNEDEHGERYLLFPQPAFDLRNPLPPDATLLLPGKIQGKENAWRVTSRGGREHFLVVVSPEPVAELEADLGKIPAPELGRPVEYASVSSSSVERLRGAGGLAELPATTAPAPAHWNAFDRFRSLAGREDGVQGLWVRHIVLENPTR